MPSPFENTRRPFLETLRKQNRQQVAALSVPGQQPQRSAAPLPPRPAAPATRSSLLDVSRQAQIQQRPAGPPSRAPAPAFRPQPAAAPTGGRTLESTLREIDELMRNPAGNINQLRALGDLLPGLRQDAGIQQAGGRTIESTLREIDVLMQNPLGNRAQLDALGALLPGLRQAEGEQVRLRAIQKNLDFFDQEAGIFLNESRRAFQQSLQVRSGAQLRSNLGALKTGIGGAGLLDSGVAKALEANIRGLYGAAVLGSTGEFESQMLRQLQSERNAFLSGEFDFFHEVQRMRLQTDMNKELAEFQIRLQDEFDNSGWRQFFQGAFTLAGIGIGTFFGNPVAGGAVGSTVGGALSGNPQSFSNIG